MALEKTSRRRRAFGRRAVALLAIALFCGCASFGSRSTLPPITAVPTGESVIGKFVWFDLLTEDAVAARSFYGQLFGWEFDASQGPSDYSLIQHRGQPIGGVAEIPGELEGSEGIWLASISVSDVDRAARLAEELGGEVLDDPLEVAGRGRLAVLRDPTGAVFVALRSASGDPPDSEPTAGAWLWTDLITNEGDAARSFYEKLVGYQVKEVAGRGEDSYQVLARDGRARAGIVQVEWERVESNWLPYVRVDDVAATAQAAESLGATVLLRFDGVALLTDPTGAAFGVQARGTEAE